VGAAAAGAGLQKKAKRFTQKATKDAKRWGTNLEGRSNIAVARFLDMPRRIAQERVPAGVQCRVARCDVRLPAQTSHPLSRVERAFQQLGRRRAYLRSLLDLFQSPGPYIVDVAINRNPLWNERVLADAPDVVDHACSRILER
jgi:hypothetical protein